MGVYALSYGYTSAVLVVYCRTTKFAPAQHVSALLLHSFSPQVPGSDSFMALAEVCANDRLVNKAGTWGEMSQLLFPLMEACLFLPPIIVVYSVIWLTCIAPAEGGTSICCILWLLLYASHASLRSCLSCSFILFHTAGPKLNDGCASITVPLVKVIILLLMCVLFDEATDDLVWPLEALLPWLPPPLPPRPRPDFTSLMFCCTLLWTSSGGNFLLTSFRKFAKA